MSSHSNELFTERSGWKLPVLGLVVIIIIAALYIFWGRASRLEKITAAEAHFSLGPNAADQASEFDSTAVPEIYYHVVLRDVPLGWGLDLGCEWFAPTGSVARRNAYQTRLIYKSTWPTHCRQQLSTEMPSGEWRVQMTMGDRVLSTSTFVLK